MKKIEHLGIAVKDLEASIKQYEKMLQTACYKTETVAVENVLVAFLKVGESKIELLQALNNKGPIAKFIEKRGEGIHHVAYEVDDIVFEMKRFEKQGYRLLNDTPRNGADNKLVCFIHPKDTSGVLTELVQRID